MSAGTLVLGLLLVLVLTPSETTLAFGWMLVVLGAVGVALRFMLPTPQQRRDQRR